MFKKIIETGNMAIGEMNEGQFKDFLLSIGQEKLYNEWKDLPADLKDKLPQQLEKINKNVYPLAVYVKNAKKLIDDYIKEVNPYKGLKPKVPSGKELTEVDASFRAQENSGLRNITKAGFAQVVGGEGQRLGFPDIKLKIAFLLINNKTYGEYFSHFIDAFQTKANKLNNENKKIPYILMTSESNIDKTRKYFEENDYFGLDPQQVSIDEAMMQGEVPAFDIKAEFILDKETGLIETKPGGHGDIDKLLYKSGIAKQLEKDGVEHIVNFQDTNALAFYGMLPFINISVENDLDMNSLTVSRVAKEAAGAIITMVNEETGEEMTFNVEYNTLDAFLKATINPEGDVNDPETGLSPFPGNINVLTKKVKTYNKVNKGQVPELINPDGYEDDTKTQFKKRPRVENNMQDFAKQLVGRKVSFANLARLMAFSALKNSIKGGQSKVAGKKPPETASTAAADYYESNRIRLNVAGGMKLVGDPAKKDFQGIPVLDGFTSYLSPYFQSTIDELAEKIVDCTATQNSVLIIDGKGSENVKLQGVTLDGALVINAVPGVHLTLKDLDIKNDSWEKVELTQEEVDDPAIPESIKIHGYKIVKHANAARVYLNITHPGEYVITGENIDEYLVEENGDSTPQ